ncbi:MAG: hypothetical protein FWC70_11375 [Defluviitaleaceae bacterium]|nr:hypothetical protein [Defluviitaleaceae bacterium]
MVFFVARENSPAMSGVFCPNPSRECSANCILAFVMMPGVLAVFPPNASVTVYAGGGAASGSAMRTCYERMGTLDVLRFLSNFVKISIETVFRKGSVHAI